LVTGGKSPWTIGLARGSGPGYHRTLMAPSTPPPGAELPPSQRPTLDPKPLCWRLVFAGHSHELHAGTSSIGRASSCTIILESPGVSRLHATFCVEGELLTIADAGSSNGVFVNGVRVTSPQPLSEGDRVVIGTQDLAVTRTSEFALQELTDSERPTMVRPQATLPFSPKEKQQTRPEPVQPRPVSTDTENLEAIEALGRVADRMLAKGRPEVAIKILSAHLRGALDAADQGQRVPQPSVRGAVHYAMKLARATSDGKWLDYVIDLHRALRLPLDPDLTLQIAREIQHGTQVDRALLEGYKVVVRELLKKGVQLDQGAAEQIFALARS
jgi:pSer/pThr/pTyr-binding forkhead associated (FHA) protein